MVAEYKLNPTDIPMTISNPFNQKIYVCFNPKTDIYYFRVMTTWKQADNSGFDFCHAQDLDDLNHTSLSGAKNRLKRRFQFVTHFVFLVNTNPPHLSAFSQWEIEQALSLDIPIIVAYINGQRRINQDLCPEQLHDALAIHVSFTPSIIHLALEQWQALHNQHRRYGSIGPHCYTDQVYSSLGFPTWPAH